MNQLDGKKVVIIGAGTGGLATAAMLARAGCNVTIYESRHDVGGRMGVHQAQGFTFDTGPSWYLMPEVYEHFFALFGKDIHDYVQLHKLTPAYKVMFEGNSQPLVITGEEQRDAVSFNALEPGADAALARYLDSAEVTYKLALKYFLYHNFRQPWRLMRPQILKFLPSFLQAAGSPLDRFVSRSFKASQIRQVLEYPAVFLGASPFTAPAIYHLMSYLDFRQGVWYPQGGMYSVTKALREVAESEGVTIHTSAPVTEITVSDGKVNGVALADGTTVTADIVVSNADLHYTQMQLLAAEHRDYSEKYWQKHEAGPSALLLYAGVKGALPELEHHNLYFVREWEENFSAIFEGKKWPVPASIYVCKPSATDTSVAPEGHENIFMLVPLPADSELHKDEYEQYAQQYLDQVARQSGVPDLRSRIVYQKVYGPHDFATDLNAWKGTALGMSHLLKQSALFRPQVKSKRVEGLYYVGANVQPGIGVPMCLISAELVYKSLTGDHSLGPIEGQL